MSTGRWPQPQHERAITRAELETLRAIAHWLNKRPYPPTIRDVASERNVTVNAARERLDALEVKGFIGRYPGRVRALWLTERGKAALAVPETMQSA